MNPLIILDPGHGGQDIGATGYDSTDRLIKEADLNLYISTYLFYRLLMSGIVDSAKLILTRYHDTTLSLFDRVFIANRAYADHPENKVIFISIHCNSNEGKPATGFEVWTSPGETESDHLASILISRFQAAQDDLWTRKDMSDDDPDKEGNLYVLGKTKMPAILVECGFINNKYDIGLLLKEDYHRKIGDALIPAISDFLHI